MTNTTTRRSLQELTTTCTAFPTWTKFEQSMTDGYMPTLRPHAGRSKAQKEWNERVTELADRLEEMGYRVWRGTK